MKQKLFTGSIQHYTLNSQLILVGFYFFRPYFIFRELVFPWHFLHTFYFLHKSQYFFTFLAANFLARLKNLVHIIRISLSTVFQVTNKPSTSTIYRSFNLRQTKSRFLIIVERSRYRSISLRSNIIYGLLVANILYKDQILYLIAVPILGETRIGNFGHFLRSHF